MKLVVSNTNQLLHTVLLRDVLEVIKKSHQPTGTTMDVKKRAVENLGRGFPDSPAPSGSDSAPTQDMWATRLGQCWRMTATTHPRTVPHTPLLAFLCPNRQQRPCLYQLHCCRLLWVTFYFFSFLNLGQKRVLQNYFRPSYGNDSALPHRAA